MPSARRIYEPVGTGAVDTEHARARASAHGFRRDDAERHGLLDIDAALDAAGLDAWLKRIAG
jgi:hypothetical protein